MSGNDVNHSTIIGGNIDKVTLDNSNVTAGATISNSNSTNSSFINATADKVAFANSTILNSTVKTLTSQGLKTASTKARL